MTTVDELIERVAAVYRPRRHHERLEALWTRERWFDASHQRDAAELALETLREAGLAAAELQPYAADGRTRYQDWMARLSWECPEAWLRVADEPGGALLLDRSTCPASVVMGSGPLGATVRWYR